MEFQYLKTMQENDLSISDLPEDAQTGIAEIKKVLTALNMSKKNPTAAVQKKLKAMDKWVYYEILDFLHDTDKNEDDIPFDAQDVIEPGKNANEGKDGDQSTADPLGLKIEQELDGLYASGNTVYSIEDLSTKAKETYNVLFDAYDEDEENGIVTTKYSLIEGKDKKFTLKLN